MILAPRLQMDQGEVRQRLGRVAAGPAELPRDSRDGHQRRADCPHGEPARGAGPGAGPTYWQEPY